MNESDLAPSEPISLAIVNARVWTGSARRPWADGVAVRGDRIAAVGSSAEIRKMCAASTRVIDAKGQMLIPGAHAAETGFIDGAWRDRQNADAPRIERGAIADFTMIDCDLTQVGTATTGNARVMLSVACGRVVFER